MRSTLNIAVLALGSLVAAKTISVDVGESGLVFNPASITAAVGDEVEFSFYPGDHNVVQGAFDKPCSVGGVSKGFYSGFINSNSGESKTTFKVTITSTDPVYFYCSQISHCQAGMVGAINPPSSGNTLDAYKTAAQSTTDSETPSTVQGGVVGTGGDDDDNSSSSSSASKTSTSSSVSKTTAANSATSAAASSASSVKSAASSAASSVASSVTNALSSVVSKASSATASPTGNAAASMGKMSYEMLGLAGVAGGMAVMMQ